MKRIILVPVLIIMMLTMVSCAGINGKNAENTEYKIAMIADIKNMEDGSFVQATWNCINEFSKTSAYLQSAIILRIALRKHMVP